MFSAIFITILQLKSIPLFENYKMGMRKILRIPIFYLI